MCERHYTLEHPSVFEPLYNTWYEHGICILKSKSASAAGRSVNNHTAVELGAHINISFFFLQERYTATDAMLIPGVADVCEGEGARLVSCVTQIFSVTVFSCLHISMYMYYCVCL